MRTLTLGLCGLTIAGLLLTGCGGGGGGGSKREVTSPPTTTTSAALTHLGAANLPPDSGIASVGVLMADDFSPDDSRNSTTPGAEYLPPQ